MDVEAAEKWCRAVAYRLDDARAELVAVGDLDWTGPAARAGSAALEEALRGVGRLRADADDALRAVQRHVTAVRASSAGCA